MNRLMGLRIMKKYVLPLILLFLILTSFVSVHMALLTAFIFTFFIPGLIFLKFFRIKPYEVPVCITIFSIMSSTYLIYFLSMFLGYSRETILISFLVFTAMYVIVDSVSKGMGISKDFLKSGVFNRRSILIFLFIFLLSLTILYKSVWFETENGIVITGSNWQDTPLHYSLIESINNGNFPPQMPYYSGVRINYHYFVDLHTAILEKVYGFMPKLLPILNSIFILIFAFSVYSLARINGEKEAELSTIIAAFGWGFSYFILFSAALTGDFNPVNNYIYQYDGFFGLPPIFDNLLQQRPLLIGFPAFAFVLNLLRDLKDRNRMILAGIITGLLFPFHFISFFCCFVAYFISIALTLRSFKSNSLYFLISVIIALPFLLPTIISMGPAASMKGPWAYYFLKGNPITYYVANLGIPFLISLTLILLKKTEEKFIKCVFVTLFLLPNLVSLTPNPWDMYKFFHFSWIPISVLSGTALARIKKGVAILLLLLSVLASGSVVLYNLSTNYLAASWDEYRVGMWIRENTEKGSVFLTYYSIHSPPTMIGGRLRVLSYLNWPYGHGIKLDEIFERMEDIDEAYAGTMEDLERVINKYNIKYVYIGIEELRNYPHCVEKFNKIEWLKLVYNGSLKVYAVCIS
ncbi:MAG: hypothetical protein QW304_04940 [Thermoproteota archaeon]